MRSVSVSSTLTVYFDGQFWVGVAERVEAGSLRASRVVFGAEPSNQEVYEFVLRRWSTLRFTEPLATGEAGDESEGGERRAGDGLPGNPKRRKRAAARALRETGGSTKAQRALAAERELRAEQSMHERSRLRAEAADEAYARRAEKRRRKRRGK